MKKLFILVCVILLLIVSVLSLQNHKTRRYKLVMYVPPAEIDNMPFWQAKIDEGKKIATARQKALQQALVAAKLARTNYSTSTAGNSDFNACVRMKESTNNYQYSGYYHGAYNMTLSHWNNYTYDGKSYPTPESAPPAAQDQKFNEDVAQGPTYMHQQYPVSSKACGI